LNDGKVSGREKLFVTGTADTRYAIRAAALAPGTGIHGLYGHDAGVGDRSHHIDLHPRACGHPRFAAGCDAGRVVPPRAAVALLLFWRVRPAGGVLAGLL